MDFKSKLVPPASRERALSEKMNVLLFQKEDYIDDNHVRVLGERADYVKGLHARTGLDRIRVGELGGSLGDGRIVSHGDSEHGGSEVVIEVRLGRRSDPSLNVTLLVALPRPQILKRVLEFCATVGVDKLVLTGTDRVEKSYFTSKVLTPEGIERHLMLGLEQGVSTRMPEVEIIERLETAAPLASDRAGFRFVADPTAVGGLERYRRTIDSDRGRTVIAVGPEGGWVLKELSLLAELGYRGFRMGDRILRVDTAVNMAVGQLQLLRRISSAATHASNLDYLAAE